MLKINDHTYTLLECKSNKIVHAIPNVSIRIPTIYSPIAFPSTSGTGFRREPKGPPEVTDVNL